MYHLISACFPQRYVVTVQTFICLTISYMMRFALSLAIVEMTPTGFKSDSPEKNCPPPKTIFTTKTRERYDFNWTAEQQGVVHAAFFWGYALTQVLGGVLADLFNHKVILMYGYMITCVFTLITPICARLFEIVGLCICRIIVGMSQGVFYNALHGVCAYWITPDERGTLGTLVFAGVHIGNSLNYTFTGFLIDAFDWDSVFYIYGIIGVIWGIIYIFTTHSKPSDYPDMKEKERLKFEEYSKDIKDTKKGKKVPVKAILTNGPVWALVFGLFGHDWCHFALLTSLPTYMKSVLHMDVKANGLLNASIYIAIWIAAVLSGILSDWIHRRQLMTLTWNRRILFFFSSALPALGFLGLTYSECDYALGMTFIIIGASAIGFYYPSVKVNPLDVSPNFAGTVGSIAQMGGMLAGVTVPYLIGKLTPNRTISEWRVAYWVSFWAVLGGGIIYCILCSAEVQPFNDLSQETEEPPAPPKK